MPDQVSANLKATIERAKEAAAKRDNQREQVADKVDAVVREKRPTAQRSRPTRSVAATKGPTDERAA